MPPAVPEHGDQGRAQSRPCQALDAPCSLAQSSHVYAVDGTRESFSGGAWCLRW
jgi:hypothetical protein